MPTFSFIVRDQDYCGIVFAKTKKEAIIKVLNALQIHLIKPEHIMIRKELPSASVFICEPGNVIRE